MARQPKRPNFRRLTQVIDAEIAKARNEKDRLFVLRTLVVNAWCETFDPAVSHTDDRRELQAALEDARRVLDRWTGITNTAATETVLLNHEVANETA